MALTYKSLRDSTTINNVADITNTTYGLLWTSTGELKKASYDKLKEYFNVTVNIDLNNINSEINSLKSRTTQTESDIASHTSSIASLNTNKLGKTENATSASKLNTARTVTFTGNVTGNFSFDGSDNVSIPLTYTAIVPVNKGGTGRSNLTSGEYLIGNGTEGVNFKTPAQARDDIIPNGSLTIAKTDGLQAALDSKATVANMAAHANNKDNPHEVTTTQIGAAKATDLNAHTVAVNNPHNVTKAQVGLGNVANYGIATKAEAEAGTVNNKYMTPLRVKEAMAASSVAPGDLNAYVKKAGTEEITGLKKFVNARIDIQGASNRHVYFRDENGVERGLYYQDANSSDLLLRRRKHDDPTVTEGVLRIKATAVSYNGSDLWTKAALPENTLVRMAGNQTIAGVKKFTSTGEAAIELESTASTGKNIRIISNATPNVGFYNKTDNRWELRIDPENGKAYVRNKRILTEEDGNEYVKMTGDQTIAGIKRFSSGTIQVVSNGSKHLDFKRLDGTRTGLIYSEHPSRDIIFNRSTADGVGVEGQVRIKATEILYNNSRIHTQGNLPIDSIVRTSGEQTISGNKIFKDTDGQIILEPSDTGTGKRVAIFSNNTAEVGVYNVTDQRSEFVIKPNTGEAFVRDKRILTTVDSDSFVKTTGNQNISGIKTFTRPCYN